MTPPTTAITRPPISCSISIFGRASARVDGGPRRPEPCPEAAPAAPPRKDSVALVVTGPLNDDATFAPTAVARKDLVYEVRLEGAPCFRVADTYVKLDGRTTLGFKIDCLAVFTGSHTGRVLFLLQISDIPDPNGLGNGSLHPTAPERLDGRERPHEQL